ncbi:hypothetical protein NH340_JMT02483 [Sarcoptes scabiei]|nr:hypothetical protein NH340_JMT02483 [Sarcoptes scabiei]
MLQKAFINGFFVLKIIFYCFRHTVLSLEQENYQINLTISVESNSFIINYDQISLHQLDQNDSFLFGDYFYDSRIDYFINLKYMKNFPDEKISENQAIIEYLLSDNSFMGYDSENFNKKIIDLHRFDLVVFKTRLYTHLRLFHLNQSQLAVLKSLRNNQLRFRQENYIQNLKIASHQSLIIELDKRLAKWNFQFNRFKFNLIEKRTDKMEIKRSLDNILENLEKVIETINFIGFTR